MTTKYRDIPFRFNMDKFGADVAACCMQLGLSMTDVDNLADVGSGTTGRIVRRELANPRLSTWLPVANVLGLNILDYFELDD